jgi:hypothetical protein
MNKMMFLVAEGKHELVDKILIKVGKMPVMKDMSMEE